MHYDLLQVSRLVVPEDQEWDYEPVCDYFGIGMETVPNHFEISETREWIVNNAVTEKFFIVDDDLRFAYRPYWELGDKSLEPCNNDDVQKNMFNGLLLMLDDYAHVGLSARAGNNHVEPNEHGSWGINTRMMCFTGYQTEVAQRMKHNRVRCRSDFDLVLQMLRQGYPNWVDYNYCYDSPGSNTSGGCSDFRTAKVLEEEAYKLADLHPGFVKVTEKKTKADWGTGGVRTDVTVYWKKAFEKGKYK